MEVLLKPRRCILKRSVCVLLWTLFLSLFVLKRNVFVLSKLLNIYCKFVKSVSIHLHQIPAAVKKYAVSPILKYTNKTFFTLWIKNYKSSFRYQFPHKYISHFDVMYKKKNENDTHVLSRIIPFEYPADSLIRKKHNLRHKTQERPLNVNRSL